MKSPAIRYATATAAGAAAEVVVSQTGWLSKTFPDRLIRGSVFGILTLLVGRQFFKGKARENITAAAVGMVIPAVVAKVGTFQLGSNLTQSIMNGNGNGNGNRRVASIRRAALSSPYSAARAHAVQDSGLKAI